MRLLALLSTKPVEHCVRKYPLHLPLLSFVSSAVQAACRKGHVALEIAHVLYHLLSDTDVVTSGAMILESLR